LPPTANLGIRSQSFAVELGRSLLHAPLLRIIELQYNTVTFFGHQLQTSLIPRRGRGLPKKTGKWAQRLLQAATITPIMLNTTVRH
jgi:hypothetical protein